MTHAVLFEFFFVVNARTNYLSVLIWVSRNNATRAVTLSEFLLPGCKTLCDVIDSLFVRIELNSSSFGMLSGPTLYLLGLFVNVHECPYLTRAPRSAKLLVRYLILLFLFDERVALFRISYRPLNQKKCLQVVLLFATILGDHQCLGMLIRRRVTIARTRIARRRKKVTITRAEVKRFHLGGR